MPDIATHPVTPPPFNHVLVTGGAGFIGSHLSEALLARGIKVTVIDNLSTGSRDNIAHLMPNPAFTFIEASVTDTALLNGIVPACDFVFHLAAAVGVELIVRDPIGVIETNVEGTTAVLRAASLSKTPVLLTSTSEVYGKNTYVPFAEDDDRVLGPTTKSRWCYAESKAVDEFLGLAYYRQRGLPVIIVRLFNTVGPRQTGQYGMVVPRFVRQALSGRPITVYGNGRQTRCFCHVQDVIRALLQLSATPAAAGEIFNVGSTEEVSILELAREVLEVTGSSSEIVFIPYDEAYEPGFEDMVRRVPSIQKIQKAIGWTPLLSLREIISDVAAYEQRHRGGEA